MCKILWTSQNLTTLQQSHSWRGSWNKGFPNRVVLCQAVTVIIFGTIKFFTKIFFMYIEPFLFSAETSISSSYNKFSISQIWFYDSPLEFLYKKLSILNLLPYSKVVCTANRVRSWLICLISWKLICLLTFM